MDFGSAIHKAMEHFHKRKAAGAEHDENLRATIRETVFSPVEVDSYRNIGTLSRTIVWYLDQFKDDPAKVIILANGKPAVELSFRFQTDFLVGDEPVILCGHLDRVVSLNEAIWVNDYKTTKRGLYDDYFSSFSPDNQMTLYTLAARVVFDVPANGVLIDAIQIGVNFSRFQRGFTLRTPDQLDEWYEDLGVWLGQAELYATANHWPMNDTACGLYGGCTFRGICSKDSALRQRFLEASFVKRKWNPLEIR
jgi:hypothetical protein